MNVISNIRQKNVIEGYEFNDSKAVLSPNGKFLASADLQDKMIKLWNFTENKIKLLQEHADSLVFSPDSKILASANDDYTIKLWNINNGKEVQELKGHIGKVYNMIFNSNGTILVSGSEDHTIKFWDVLQGKEIKTLSPYYVTSFLLSPDDKMLVLHTNYHLEGKIHSEIKLINVKNDEEITTLQLPYSINVKMSPDGNLLVLGDNNGMIRLWRITDDKNSYNTSINKNIITWQAHSNQIRDIAFSFDNKLLASASNSSIKVWSIEKGQKLNEKELQLSKENTTNHIQFSPDNTTLLIESGGFWRHDVIEIWDITDQDKEEMYSNFITDILGGFAWAWSIKFSPDGKMLAVGGSSPDQKKAKIIVWNTKSYQPIITLNDSLPFHHLDFSPDSSILAFDVNDNTIKLQWMRDRKKISIQGITSPFVFHPDGKILAAIDSKDKKIIKLWKIHENQEILRLQGHSDIINSLAFNYSGTILASGSADHTIKIWDISSGKEMLSLQGHDEGVASIAFHPNGTILVSGGYDSSIKLWNIVNGREIWTLKAYTQVSDRVFFSPDGLILMSGGYDFAGIKLWDIKNKSEIGPIPVIFSTTCLDFSPNGKIIATAGQGSAIILRHLDRLDDYLFKGCEWLYNYLNTNPILSDADRTLCDDILHDTD